MSKVGHRTHLGELTLVEGSQVGKPKLRRLAARPSINLANLLDRDAIPIHSRMSRLTLGQRLGQNVSCLFREIRRKRIEGFALAFELEPEIGDGSAHGQRRLLALRVVREGGVASLRVLPNQVGRHLRAFDRGAWVAELVREVAKLSGNRPPTTADARFRYACLIAARRLFVNHEREWHVPGEQLLKASQLSFAGTCHPVGQWQADAAVDARHSEGRILDGFDERTAPIRPSLNPLLVEQMARKTVYLTHRAGVCERLGVQIIRRQMIAPRNDQSIEIAFLARHSVQRLH